MCLLNPSQKIHSVMMQSPQKRSIFNFFQKANYVGNRQTCSGELLQRRGSITERQQSWTSALLTTRNGNRQLPLPAWSKWPGQLKWKCRKPATSYKRFYGLKSVLSIVSASYRYNICPSTITRPPHFASWRFLVGL